MKRFCDFISAHNMENNLAVFHEITKPRKQIESLLDNIQVTLSEIFHIERDNIGLSVLYKPNMSETWEFIESVNTINDLDLTTLVTNPNTTARQIIDKKNTSLLFPDKKIAAHENKYIPGPKDESYNNI